MADREASTKAVVQPEPAAPLVDNDDLAEFCTFHEDYVSRNIQLADTKAALVLVAFSSVIALSLKDAHFMQALRDGFPPSLARGFSCTSSLAWLALVLCGAGTAMALWVVIPRFETGRVAEQDRGYTYWKDVAERTGEGDGEAYVGAVRRLTTTELVDDRLRHLGQLSRVCARKMWWLPCSMWCGIIGVAAAALWILLYAEHIG